MLQTDSQQCSENTVLKYWSTDTSTENGQKTWTGISPTTPSNSWQMPDFAWIKDTQWESQWHSIHRLPNWQMLIYIVKPILAKGQRKGILMLRQEE